MVCKTTFIERRAAAFTLVEGMVATAVGLLLMTAVLSFFFYSNRSFAAMANYMDLDQRTQFALDKMSREIRQVTALTGYSSTNLIFQDNDGLTLSYVYDANLQALTRSKSGVTENLLTNCSSLQFSIFQRTPSNNTFQPWTATSVTNTKAIELTWNCYRTISGVKINTENMQSAKIVIRAK
jgi:hypothetical protein